MMNKRWLSITSLFLFFWVASLSYASEKIVIKAVRDVKSLPIALQGVKKQRIKAKQYRLVEIDMNELRAQLAGGSKLQGQSADNVWIELPLLNKTMHQYQVKENDTMAPELAKKYPEIKAFDGRRQNEWVKFDITPKGFHAMIMRPGKSTIFIDPFTAENQNYYMVYQDKDYISTQKMSCGVEPSSFSKQPHPSHLVPPLSSHPQTPYISPCLHRTYRLALAATYQYTLFAGGTLLDALSSEVTTINRVNGIYESEAAITLQLIANNDLMICTYPGCFSSSVAPYYSGVVPYNSISTGGTTGQLVVANQTNTDIIIGTGNYDVGHVVDYNGGYKTGDGLAWTPSVCNSSNKAKGATSGAQPLSDLFDVDFLAHELGHQFSATHTQNNDCQRETHYPTSVEPGSGSTIMGYAGICAPNVQTTSGPYFHGVSLEQIANYSQGAGNCSTNVANAAAAPVITGSNGNSTVPVNTPFSLKVVANAPSGTTLTYNWEQMDATPSTQPPVATATSGPNFRSFQASTEATRYFPNLLDAGTSAAIGLWPTWEVVPSVARTMNFRVTVRNNVSGPSCNAYQDYTVTEVNEGGGNAFSVTQPNAPGIYWAIGSSQAVTWEVANTDGGSVEAGTVDILLSLDGGATYAYTLATSVTNNGSYAVTVPNLPTSTARIMVTDHDRTFFNVSGHDVAIANPQITRVERNPNQRTTAFLYYSGIPSQWLESAHYYLNIGTGDVDTITIQSDLANHRLIMTNLTNPRAFSARIRVNAANGVSVFTNTFTIPSALNG